MSARITGKIFNDLNHNGVYNAGEPGISGAYVVAYNSSVGCLSGVSNSSGDYSINITQAGTYTIYETVSDPQGVCPPIATAQPTGFTDSTTLRMKTVTVTLAQISNNQDISGNNFGHDNATKFNCNGYAYQTDGSPTSNLNKIEIVTGKQTFIANLGIGVNGIGYNPLDNLIYAFQSSTNNLIRIDGNGIVTNLGAIANMPVNSYVIATIDNNGYMYVYSNNNSRYYTINLRADSVNYGKLVDPKNSYILQTSNYGTALSIAMNIVDWAYDIVTGQLYGIRSDVAKTIYKINQNTGAVSSLSYTGSATITAYGATFTDSTGMLYGIQNSTGKVYRFDLSTNPINSVYFSQAIATNNNDGAGCVNQVISIDFGDAPDLTALNGTGDYSTKLENNGPRHRIIDNLFIGTTVTAESNALQNSTATGDLDDGVTLPLTAISTSNKTYSFDIEYTNNTGADAYMYAWIDFDKNGIFSGDEAITRITLPSSTTNPRVTTLNFTVPSRVNLTSGETFVRVRLTRDNLINSNNSYPTLLDTRSIGPASDGEVEDYLINIYSKPVCPGNQSVEGLKNNNLVGTYTAIDPEGLTLTYSIGTEANFGTVNINSSTGVWEYIPTADFIGNDSFTIVATNSLGDSCEGAIYITIKEIGVTVEKISNTDTVNRNQEIIYTIVVTNTGNIPLSSVVVTDLIPTNTTYIDGSLQPALGDITTGVDIGALAIGEQFLLSFAVLVNRNVSLGTTIGNYATIVANAVIGETTGVENLTTNTVNTIVTAAGCSTDGMQVQRTLGSSVLDSGAVIFDKKIYDHNSRVDYNSSTGVFTVYETGRYFVAWWVAAQTSAGTYGNMFNVQVSNGVSIQGASAFKTGLVSGSAYLTVTTAPATFTLSNKTNGSVTYAKYVTVKANLVVNQCCSFVDGDVGAKGVTGDIGPIGNTAATGVTGATGVKGATGITGATGTTGDTGITGDTGATGVTGDVGSIGEAGATGYTGEIGMIGATGETGVTGAVGTTGATGETGVTGIVGITGVTGEVGATGNTGITGNTGATGATGNQGSLGATGVTGEVGKVGSTGNIGSTGATGAMVNGYTGDTGATGAIGGTGVLGATGVTGFVGATGANGATGATGASPRHGGILAEIINGAGDVYANNAILIFNDVLMNNATTINYDASTGIITFNQKGYYIIDYWFGIEGTSPIAQLAFVVTDSNDNIVSSMPVNIGQQIYGNALFHVTTVPVNVTVRNYSGNSIQLANYTDVQGMIRILE